MRPQFCRESAPHGDCYRACLATVTGLPAETMPNFMHLTDGGNGDDGMRHARDWLAGHGLTIFSMWAEDLTLEKALADCSGFNPGVPVIFSGWCAPANDGHSVVALDGRIVHDPSGVGLTSGSRCRCGDPACTRTHWMIEVIVPLKENV